MSSNLCFNAIVAELEDEDDESDIDNDKQTNNIEDEDEEAVDIILLTYTAESSTSTGKNQKSTKIPLSISRLKCSPAIVGANFDLIPQSIALVNRQRKVFRAVIK